VPSAGGGNYQTMMNDALRQFMVSEIRKVYCALTDIEGVKHRQRRVIDESGEDYLLPRRYFVDLPVPPAVRRALSALPK
jgi:hypothetical protein